MRAATALRYAPAMPPTKGTPIEGEVVSVRLTPELLKAVDEEVATLQRQRPDDRVTRGHAVRSLLRFAVEAKKSKPTR